MSALSNLKNRSFSRMLFAIGMAVAFIGFVIPTFYVTPKAEIESTEDEGELDFLSGLDLADDTVSGDTLSSDANPFEGADEANADVNPFAAADESNADANPFAGAEEPNADANPFAATEESTAEAAGGTDEAPADSAAQESQLKNIFTAATFFNNYTITSEDGDEINTAYNATFIVLMWLATLAGLIVFFVCNTYVVDIIVWALGTCFGIASAITIPMTLHVTPIFGYFSVGGYFVLIGWIIALVGIILESKEAHK